MERVKSKVTDSNTQKLVDSILDILKGKTINEIESLLHEVNLSVRERSKLL